MVYVATQDDQQHVSDCLLEFGSCSHTLKGILDKVL